MGSEIIRLHPDRDLYIRWSTVVMGVTHEGTRAELRADLADRYPDIDDDLDRAERTGTSWEAPDDDNSFARNEGIVFNDDEAILVSEIRVAAAVRR
jgi:hypothetical protein